MSTQQQQQDQRLSPAEVDDVIADILKFPPTPARAELVDKLLDCRAAMERDREGEQR